MPWITCPGNPDCKIECPGSGSAYYIHPHGPCEVNCDPLILTNELQSLFAAKRVDVLLSGKVVGIAGSSLADFAKALRRVRQQGPSEYLDDLEALGGNRRNEVFSAEWEHENMEGVLEKIVEATRQQRRAA